MASRPSENLRAFTGPNKEGVEDLAWAYGLW